MTRTEALQRLDDRSTIWDVLVIGGGATGLGCAVDAAARGYRTLLLEKSDFAKATSSRSTKLIHGGVRYLKQGNLSLVRESLRERGLLLRNAPHLVHRLPFLVPCFSRWERIFYGAGLKTYDLLAGRLNLGPSGGVSADEALRLIPTLGSDGLRGGVRYYDGQFDDARLAVSLAQTVRDLGGATLNYCGVESLLKVPEKVTGVTARDEETGRVYEVRARAVINATGIFTDQIRHWDEPAARGIMTVSQGAHIVLPASFLPGDTALMIPKTRDGRVLFAIPWHGRVLVGTTDTPRQHPEWEPRPLEEEIQFLLDHAGRYLSRAPQRSDVLSTFAGLRPLVSSGGTKNTAKISRDHTLLVSDSGLVTITGGKWTTYRRMAEDAVDRAAEVAGLERRPSRTQSQKLHGWVETAGEDHASRAYGSDAGEVRALAGENSAWSEPLHPSLPYTRAEVIWAVRREMARTVEDVLARRTRALVLDARGALACAAEVARLMAEALGQPKAWEGDQVREFGQLAEGYVLAETGASGGISNSGN